MKEDIWKVLERVRREGYKVATPNLILDCPQSRIKNQEKKSDEEEEEKIWMWMKG